MNKLALSVTASVIALSTPALAQVAATPPAPPASEAVGLEEIIVTAQRRGESLQRAAVAIDVVSAQDIQAQGITQPERLVELSPALTIQGTSVGAVIFVRGVGNFTLTPNSDPATAFNYDGVYLGRPTSTGGTFYDLQRVEVLKGPQGTLYGRNATAGAINVIPQHPELGVYAGYANVSYGNYDALAAEGAVNIPLGEKAALRVSANHIRRDGYLRDGTNDENSDGLRVQLLAEPTPELKIRLAADYSHGGGLGASLSYDSDYRYDAAAGRYVRRLSNLPVSEGIGTPAADAYRATLPAGPAGRNLDALGFTPNQNNRFYGLYSEISYETGLGVLTVLPAWRYADLDFVSSAGGFGYLINEADEQYSLEVRFAGDRVGPIDYILGGFYYHETIDNSTVASFSASLNFGDSAYRTESFAPFARATFHVNDKLRLVGGVRYTKDRKAFDGTATTGTIVCTVVVAGALSCPTAPLYPLVPELSDIKFDFPAAGAPPVPIGGSGAINVRSDRAFSSRLTTDRVTYRAAVEYDVAPASLFYGSVETGFRSGGFSAAVGYDTYDPEYITAYTLGLKNRFFDNRLQLNIEAFRWQYRNQQISAVTYDKAGQAGLIIQNIGSTRIQGVEVSASAAVTANTVLSADLQYLDAEARSFAYEQANLGAPPLTGCPSALASGGAVYKVDCAGYPAFNSPRWTMNLSAEHTIPVGEHQIVLSANTQYRAERYVGFAYLDAQLVPSSWLSNAQVSFGPQDEKWLVAAFVRNIENNRTVTYSYTHPLANSVANGSSAPRTYGVRANMRF